jgi:hypothetical protein
MDIKPSTQFHWYTLVSAFPDEHIEVETDEEQPNALEQGDIVESFEFLIPADPAEYPNIENPTEKIGPQAFILMSHSCDLAEGKTGGLAILCPVYVQSDFNDDHPIAKKDGLQNLRKGALPGFYLLNKCELPDFERPFRIVDFQTVVSVSLHQLLTHVHTMRRLRLLPPYREHLSQAFARFFMRVGLPEDIILPGDKPRTRQSGVPRRKFKQKS